MDVDDDGSADADVCVLVAIILRRCIFRSDSFQLLSVYIVGWYSKQLVCANVFQGVRMMSMLGGRERGVD
jgi:hypothetical protein